MNLQQAAQQALEALEKVKVDADKQSPVYPWDVWRMWVDGAITDLRAALAEPECKCTMRQKMVGDGCAVCNPERAKDLAEPQTTYREGCEAVHPECKTKPITTAEMSAWVKDTWEKCQAEAWQKPSGSFVLWENTLCNPLSDPRSMAHSAWHDGYASGVKVEREECARMCENLEMRNDCYDGTGNYVAGWSDGTDDCAAAIRSRGT